MPDGGRLEEDWCSPMGRVADLRSFINVLSWAELRHERERAIWMAAFWDGYSAALAFVRTRLRELQDLTPEERALYTSLGGWQP